MNDTVPRAEYDRIAADRDLARRRERLVEGALKRRLEQLTEAKQLLVELRAQLGADIAESTAERVSVFLREG